MEKTTNALGIKTWAEEDRPREKMLLKGTSALSNSELLAILIGSGTVGESAVDLAKKILRSADDNLNALGKFTISDLKKNKGIGEAKAITIAAALELGRRRQLTEMRTRPKVQSSRDAYDVIAQELVDLPVEQFWVLLLNQGNEIIKKINISTGGTTATVVDVKTVLKPALESLSPAIILVHNHPSGNLNPSMADKKLTEQIFKAAAMMDIRVLDHLIVSDRGYYSFADEGAMSY